eukprot:CAMPEP_0119322412 /NCGR_PEP_ID=MMETSP1333-20130426/58113_1 /TAXON_ID=418940 /ORGANISM="Scyphosphaera apsteinii, Strain RCC1455" /LENGTH=77 /DNA_ID=CAMNT_0007329639 /DNA_START=170 /DNA_END=400 /DNA_ORIENTATION=-
MPFSYGTACGLFAGACMRVLTWSNALVANGMEEEDSTAEATSFCRCVVMTPKVSALISLPLEWSSFVSSPPAPLRIL